MKIGLGRAKIILCSRESSNLSNPIVIYSFTTSLLLLVLGTNTIATAQWKSIAKMNGQIYSIYFKEFTQTPEEGFISVWYNNVKRPDVLWRTIDGGLTWQNISYPAAPNGDYDLPNSFTFKNSQEGWWSGGAASPTQSFFKTVDGGLTWQRVDISPLSIGSIFYVPSTNLLILPGASTGFSSDGGTTIQMYPPMSFEGGGVAFSDNIHGIIAPRGGTGGIVYTDDGGITLKQSLQEGERFQPIGIKGTLIFYALQEGPNLPAGDLVKSTDGGMSWQKVYQYSKTGFNSVTGIMQYNQHGIFFQTAQNNSEGIMMSNDSGNSFYSICGPVNDFDTHFYVRDSFIYAADKNGGLWLNTTGIGSNSTPQLSVSILSMAPLLGCTEKDTSLIMTFFDSCNNIQGQLNTIELLGSKNFSLSAPYDKPRTIHPNDSILIHYSPQSSSPDTSKLHLVFHLGWKDFDTIITLTGGGKLPVEKVQLNASFTNNNIPPGGVTDLLITPDKAEVGKGLDSISFDLLYNGDLLTETNVSTQVVGASILPSPLTPLAGRARGMNLVVHGNNISLDPTKAIADVTFRASLTDTNASNVSISNLKLNSGDPTFSNCILSADPSATTFTLALECGDTTIQQFLRTGTLRITSLQPNPTQEFVTLILTSSAEQAVTVEMVNPLGEVLTSFGYQLTPNFNMLRFDMRQYPAGAYYMLVRSSSGVVGQMLIISR